jgi:hypothetical protein
VVIHSGTLLLFVVRFGSQSQKRTTDGMGGVTLPQATWRSFFASPREKGHAIE